MFGSGGSCVTDPNRALFESVVCLLGPVLDELVFVGGCTTGLFLTDLAAGGVRPTKDVDAIIVDIMPMDASVLGFSNRWYPTGFETAQTRRIAGHDVRIVTPTLFIATKLVAMSSRVTTSRTSSQLWTAARRLSKKSPAPMHRFVPSSPRRFDRFSTTRTLQTRYLVCSRRIHRVRRGSESWESDFELCRSRVPKSSWLTCQQAAALNDGDSPRWTVPVLCLLHPVTAVVNGSSPTRLQPKMSVSTAPVPHSHECSHAPGRT